MLNNRDALERREQCNAELPTSFTSPPIRQTSGTFVIAVTPSLIAIFRNPITGRTYHLSPKQEPHRGITVLRPSDRKVLEQVHWTYCDFVHMKSPCRLSTELQLSWPFPMAPRCATTS